MRHFNSMGDFGLHLVELAAKEVVALKAGLEVAAKHVEKTAKDEIGHYQEAVGSFPAWAPLADSTEKEKARLGYPLDAPLLRTGELRDEITHEVEGLEAVVGSHDPVMVYQELGTPTIPPRPVLGPAALHEKQAIERILGAAAVSGILGATHILPQYGFETSEE
jgi:phage gpG-like protein